ncbi:LysR substrate-binding domain-containing protein [Polynucleobacter necessarius]|uniref:LysR substrate-binding domain-containing protein n=1 Tax=Polynucleobacter necessarius TaxID=576610 RepID=UPI0013B05EF4|nr:LysR substrate-binding domain-containing protein [Polynucleobacter necessarius]
MVPLFEDQLFLASSKATKPAQAHVDLSDYEGEKFLTLQDGFATRSGFYEAFQLAGFKPHVVMKVGGYLLSDEYGLWRSWENPLARSCESINGRCH